MRLLIRFNGRGHLNVPKSYNELLQGFIYNHLNETFAQFVHNRGFNYGKRTFKMFTFSRLLGKVRPLDDAFRVSLPVDLVISSPCADILQSLAENLLKEPNVCLAGESLQIESISVKVIPKIGERIEIKMLSPVTVYSTLQGPDGRKKTYYYNPKEEEFSLLIKENIIKKYRAFYGKEPDSFECNIEPLRVSKKDEKIVTYKNFVIKGWMGKYRLIGNPELIRLAYEAGLGTKNSQGFGCFEVVG